MPKRKETKELTPEEQRQAQLDAEYPQDKENAGPFRDPADVAPGNYVDGVPVREEAPEQE